MYRVMKSFREFSEELESTETGQQSRAEIARQRFAAQRDKARERRKLQVSKMKKKFSSGEGSSNVQKAKFNTMDAKPKPEEKES